MFADTYVAEWKKRRVTAKRLIIGGHRSPDLAPDHSDWIVEEIAYLRFEPFSTQIKDVADVVNRK